MSKMSVYRDDDVSLRKQVERLQGENSALTTKLRAKGHADALRAGIHLGASWAVYGIAVGFNYWWCPKTAFALVGLNLLGWAITQSMIVADSK